MQKAQGDQSHPAGTETEQESAKSQGCLFTHSPTPSPSLNRRYIPGIESARSFLLQMQAVTISMGEIKARCATAAHETPHRPEAICLDFLA